MVFYRIIIIAVCVVAQFNCFEANASSADNTIEYDVYVAGNGSVQYAGSQTWTTIAKYWKNGEEFIIGEAGSYARAIAVSGNDVYVAGHEGGTAVYWKNGVKVNLTDGKDQADAYSISVVGNDVYVCGVDSRVVTYWVNGVARKFSYNDSEARSIKIVPDGTIYIAGSKAFRANEHNAEATYWKISDLPNMVTLSNGYYTEEYATSIDIDNDDVYVAGWQRSSPAWTAKYWKNGDAVILPDAVSATSIFAYDGDVYVSGYQYRNMEYEAKYWKNGEEITLPDGAEANSITVSGDDVFVAGSSQGATYWRNGTKHILPNGSSADGICVTSNNAFLKMLSTGQHTLVPGFNPEITSYVINAGNSTDEIGISSLAKDRGAKISGNGTHALNEGENIIEIIVTASDNVTTKTYTVNIVRSSKSSNANLKSLHVDPGVPAPQFNRSITNYVVNLPNNIAGITVLAEAEDENAMVSGNGYHALNVGNNVVDVIVKAENGTTVKTYTLNVIRAAIGTNADLKALTVDNGVLYPDFSPGVTDYTLTVSGDATGVMIIGEAQDDKSDITGNGYYPIGLDDISINIVVEAEDGVTTKTYSVNVIRDDTGNGKILPEENVIIYPNPAKNVLNIRTGGSVGKVEIFNSSGTCIINVKNADNLINVSNLPAGFYFLNIRIDNRIIIRKLIICE
jgi:hypothetical protein